MKSLIVFATSTLLAGNSYSASFDFQKASTKNELTICNDSELSYHDDLLAQTYRSRAIVSRNQERDELKKAQIAWLNKRNSCESSVCILTEYKNRINELRNDSSVCIRFKENVIAGAIKPILFEAKGSIKDFWNIIGIDSISDDIKKKIVDDSYYSHLYRAALNSDNIDDFVVTTTGGSASCTSYYFLISHEDGYELAPGVNYSNYSNEGKLCSA